MPDLILRNVDEEVAERLRHQARANGVSTEEEHRRILRRALQFPETCRPSDDFKEHLHKLPDVGKDSDFERIAGSMREIDLSE